MDIMTEEEVFNRKIELAIEEINNAMVQGYWRGSLLQHAMVLTPSLGKAEEAELADLCKIKGWKFEVEGDDDDTPGSIVTMALLSEDKP